MNVIAKISCYFEHSAVTLKLHKEYLNTATYNTSVLHRIKCWTVWYIDAILCQHIWELQISKDSLVFLAHPVPGVLKAFSTSDDAIGSAPTPFVISSRNLASP